MSTDPPPYLSLYLLRDGVPWIVEPGPTLFPVLRDAEPLVLLALPAGTPFDDREATYRATWSMRVVAAAQGGGNDVVLRGSRTRFELDGCSSRVCDVQTIGAVFDEERMRKAGHRLLELIEEAVRRPSAEALRRLQVVVRYFPGVAFRHPRLTNELSRRGICHADLRRWFGLPGGRGRPAKPIPDALRLGGTFRYELAEQGSVSRALGVMESAGLGGAQVLANFNAKEQELQRLLVEGVWVGSGQLLDLPWIPQGAGPKRWDIYRVTLPVEAADERESNERA